MESEIQLAIADLNVDTDLNRFQTLATLSDSERSNLNQLQQQKDALNFAGSASRIEIAKTDLTLYELLRTTAKTVLDFDWDLYETSRERKERAEKERTLVANVVTPVSITSDDLRSRWDDFMMAGGAYLKELGKDDYPAIDDVCIYCRQRLGTEALQLIQRYQEYLIDPIQDELNSAITELNCVISDVKNLDINTLSSRLDAKILASEDNQHTNFNAGLVFATKVKHLINDLVSQSKVNSSDYLQKAESGKCMVEIEIQNTKKLITLMRTTDETTSSEIKRISTELQPLEDRLELKRALKAIIEYVQTLRWKLSAESAIRK